MQYVLYILLVAVIFGLVALCDLLLKKLGLRQKAAAVVRLPRYSFILGLLIALLGLIAVLYVPRQTELFLWLGGWVVLAMGVGVLVNFFWTGVFYDDAGFTYRVFPRKGRTYRYRDITAQQSYVARSGWNSNLYVNGEEVHLYAAMQGLPDFLNKAFFAWCREKGIDPDTVENDPHNLIFFPQPEDDA